MAWIESHTGLERHPKLILFKSRMRWSKNEAVGFLHRFWWTVLEYAPNGVISTLSDEVMTELLGMPSEQIAQAITALEECGFVVRQDGNKLLIKNWWKFTHRYLSETKFKSDPVRLQEIRNLYLSIPQEFGESEESPRIILGKSKVPNQPNHTNHKRPPPAEEPKKKERKPPITAAQRISEYYRDEWRKLYAPGDSTLPVLSKSDWVIANKFLERCGGKEDRALKVIDGFLAEMDERIISNHHPFPWLMNAINKHSVNKPTARAKAPQTLSKPVVSSV